MPGRLIHAVKRAGSNNPVIVLDEIDKLGADSRGDPTSALLEALDVEQNSCFVDHYLDVPWDLSQVLFVCTANMADRIPSALHDRLEMIEISGYIHEEKIQIADRHLLSRLRKEHGLEGHDVTITTDAVSHIIEELGAVEYLTEVACPSESYDILLGLDMQARHPKASVHILEHVGSLEVLLDTSILSGFSYGPLKRKSP